MGNSPADPRCTAEYASINREYPEDHSGDNNYHHLHEFVKKENPTNRSPDNTEYSQLNPRNPETGAHPPGSQ